jgi:hypothetical protein
MATSLITSAQAIAIDKGTLPDNGQVKLGTKIYDLSQSSMIAVKVVIDADYHSTGKAVTIPVDFELIDVIVQARASSSNGTAIVKKSATAITDAIIMAVDTVITKAGTIDDGQSTILTTDTITVLTNGANDRGLVTLIGVRT